MSQGRREDGRPGEPKSCLRGRDQLATYLKYVAFPKVRTYSGRTKGIHSGVLGGSRAEILPKQLRRWRAMCSVQIKVGRKSTEPL